MALPFVQQPHRTGPALRLVPAPPPRSPLPPYRYRLRRVVTAFVLGATLVAALQLIGPALVRISFSAAPSRPRPGATAEIVVRPGDTLWSIALERAEGDDPRGAVDQLVALNGSPNLIAGQSLRLPAGWVAPQPAR